MTGSPIPQAAPRLVGPRIELKRLAAASAGDELLAWARERMSPDGHGHRDADPSYLVESIYFDSPGYHSYYAAGPVPLPKHRLRRYQGSSDHLHLEEKLRIGERVWKRRQVCTAAESVAVASGQPQRSGDSAWFQQRFQLLQLTATVVLRHQRCALLGDASERMTVDRQITVGRTRGVAFATTGAAIELQRQPVIELKWLGAPTALVRDLMRRLGHATDACSKDGQSVRALGLRQSVGPAA